MKRSQLKQLIKEVLSTKSKETLKSEIARFFKEVYGEQSIERGYITIDGETYNDLKDFLLSYSGYQVVADGITAITTNELQLALKSLGANLR